MSTTEYQISHRQKNSYGVEFLERPDVALALKLHDQGQTYKEIAPQVGTSFANVGNWITRCRKLVGVTGLPKKKRGNALRDDAFMAQPQVLLALSLCKVGVIQREIAAQTKMSVNGVRRWFDRAAQIKEKAGKPPLSE